ncbi:MAG: DNA mismatch repair endonuclease MutL [Acidobacteria bacterium]|nr:DNA mismatch repair endonuclease MutL [Acidobacteriota bacterium]
MGKINRLPSDLANQIAAGEVVERPASVVKELVENAIDAGARRLKIHIELGGKKQVRVEDDGEGMEPDDARLAVERHATSKIRHADDLAAILTLGFRGEALPSIASVSHFVLRTRARGHESGTEIRVNGGAVASIVEVGAPDGTVVEVNDVFYNLPARRKFLKSDAAESAQVSRIVTQLALGYPEVGFMLTSGGRTVIQCPPAVSLRDRLYQLYGERDDLIEVKKEAGGVRIAGYAAALAEQGPTRGPQNVFINRRIVKDRTIAHAIIDAYSQASIKERSPEVHLFIGMAPGALDVNVHPTKAEVRFRDQSLVHEVVRRALMDALGQGGVPQLQLQQERATTGPIAAAIPGILGGAAFPSRWMPPSGTVVPGARVPGVPGLQMPSATAPGTEHLGTSTSAPGHPGTVTPGTVAPGTLPPGTLPEIRPMIALGQFRDTFIIAVDDEGIAIIDQHVAHERVLFERVMQRLTIGRLESQRLLVPMLLELPASAQRSLLNRAPELETSGFELESFGDTTIKVTALPALLKTADCAKALFALSEDLEGLDRGADVQDALQRIAATTACHAAVKANYPLTYDKMMHILDELRATAFSTVCPHGRPVMLRLTRREIEKNFDRI